MPKPNKGESQKDFIARCVKQVVGEGKDQKAALGQCFGTWRSERGGTAKLFSEIMDDHRAIAAGGTSGVSVRSGRA